MRVFLTCFAIAILALALCACQSDDDAGKQAPSQTGDVRKRETQETRPAENQPPKIAAPENDKGKSRLEQPFPASVQADKGGSKKPQEAKPALTEEERKNADRMLAFNNQAQRALARGYFALPDALHKAARYYLENYRLPRCPQIMGRQTTLKHLTPPKGLFNDNEEKILAANLKKMDEALAGMLASYKEMEKYVVNPEIRDDGREGRIIGKKIAAGHSAFMAARKSWLEIVEANVAKAETAILAGHPLQRQIMAAGKIFAQFREISLILRDKKPDRQMLKDLRQNLVSIANDAARPPFEASPDLERLYRGFLTRVNSYVQFLDLGIEEGFFTPQRRDLRHEARECRIAYNNFAREANRHPRK